MIKFSFADLREREKWHSIRFDVDSDLLVDDGLNLAGNCQNVNENGEKCGQYNIICIGMINKTENAGDKLQDLRKTAFRKLEEGKKEEEGIFASEDADIGRCVKCKNRMKT